MSGYVQSLMQVCILRQRLIHFSVFRPRLQIRLRQFLMQVCIPLQRFFFNSQVGPEIRLRQYLIQICIPRQRLFQFSVLRPKLQIRLPRVCV